MKILLVLLSVQITSAMFEVQMTEKILKTCTTYFLLTPGSTWEMIVAEDERERKRTLGYFLHKLRERIEVDPEFDKALASFLADRNKFAHNFSSIPGFDLGNDVGIEVGIQFAKDLAKQAVHVRGMLVGLVQVVASAMKLDAVDFGEKYEGYEKIALPGFKPKA